MKRMVSAGMATAAIVLSVGLSGAAAKSCPAGFTHAVIGGQQKCLHAGEYCSHAERASTGVTTTCASLCAVPIDSSGAKPGALGRSRIAQQVRALRPLTHRAVCAVTQARRSPCIAVAALLTASSSALAPAIGRPTSASRSGRT